MMYAMQGEAGRNRVEPSLELAVENDGERQGTVKEKSTFVNRTVLYAAEYAVGEPASNQRAWRAISAGPQRATRRIRV